MKLLFFRTDKNSTQYTETIENLPQLKAFNFTTLFQSPLVVNLSKWNVSKQVQVTS